MGRDARRPLDAADIVAHLAEGLQVIGPDWTYLFLNPVAASHGKRPAAELIGRRMTDMYPGIDQTEMFSHLARVMRDGGAHQMENEFTFPDGSTGWFELRMARIPQGVMLLSIDITARKALERQLNNAARMEAVGQLAGGVAHDFNNLLTIIRSYASFVQDGLQTGSQARADVEQIALATARAAALTRKLLAFARQMPQELHTFAVGAAIRDLGQFLDGAIGEQVTLELECADDAGRVCMDPGALDQILMNLAVNARDAMPDGGTLRIAVTRTTIATSWSPSETTTLRPGSYAVITVSDTGTGMPPEVLQRVFEPFFTTRSDAGGTGLGLATAWGLAQQAGGALTAYSEVDRGTSFRLYLPESQAEPRPEPVAATSRSAPAGERILLVENEGDLREAMARVLREAGYRVVESPSGADALLLAEDIGDKLDLLVTDVMMPRLGGIELAHRLRRRHPHLPVLLASGFAPHALGDQGHPVGDLPMLVKPFSPEELLEAVRAALDAAPPPRAPR